MYRKLASAILVASALNAKYAFALGLGGMTMHSALNQPLDAEIALSSVGDLDKTQISIGLASQDEFVKAGVDRTFFLSEIKFEVILDGRGGGVVKLRSSKLLNEPYLDVLLEAKWPTGRVLRSYTALVDLPVYEENKAVDVNAGEISASTPASELGFQPVEAEEPSAVSSSVARQPAPVKRDEKPAPVKRAAPKSVPSTSSGSDSYKVESGDTLSAIASRMKPADDVSINQTMLAIQRLNPNAFTKNNINLLKSGVVLRVPTEADVREVTAAAARSAVAEQNREWRGRQIDATDTQSSKSVAMPKDQDDGHLSLTSAGAGMANGRDNLPKSDNQSSNAQGSKVGESSAEAKALKDEAKQIKKMIEVKDAELAKLQDNLSTKKAEEKTTAPSIDDLRKSPDAESKDAAPIESAPVESAQPESAEAEKPVEQALEVKEEAPAEPVAEVKPEPEVAEVEESFIDKLKNNPMLIGIPGFLLIIGVVAVLFRRKAQADRLAMEQNDFENFDFDSDVKAEPEVEAVEEYQEQESFVEEDNQSFEEELDEVEETTMQTSDPIGEADIYIAYGRYDQAVELLTNALRVAPGNVEIRKKLLEIYVESGNKDGFQEQYIALQQSKSTGAVAFAKELLSTADGVSSWLDDLPEEEIEVVEEVAELALQDDVVEEDEIIDLSEFDDLEVAEPEAAVEEVVVDETPFDFDLSDMGLTESEATIEDVSDDLNFDTDIASFDELDSDFASLDIKDVAVDDASESLDFGDLDFSAELEETPAQTVAEVEEELSFELGDDLTFESTDDLSVTSEETAISFDDFDLSDELTDAASSELTDFDDLVVDETVTDLAVAEESAFDDLALSSDFDVDLGADETAVTNDAVEDAFADSFIEEDITPAIEAVEEVSIVSNQEFDAQPVAAAHESAPLAVLGDDLEFLTDGDEVSTKLDLAQAYVDLGDVDGAREILLEVMKEGKEEQKAEAAALLDTLD